ncbi:MAG TPA: ATP-binding protein [Burkholderiaceae bacterium]
MLRERLRLKVSVYLAIALSPAIILFPFFIVTHQQERVQAEVARHATQISEIVVKSTRYAMLLNRRDMAEKIVLDIGGQEGLERVRILNKDGVITHSNRTAEIGLSISRASEPCVHCHQSGTPLERVPEDQRWRIYQGSGGHRVLGAMEAIRNEPSCSSASCHEHPSDQSVLGVVDVAYSLEAIDRSSKNYAVFIVLVTLGVILLVALSVGFLLQRLIYQPLKDLESGARRVAVGDLEHDIAVRNQDELGRVASSFNQMTAALKTSTKEMQELVQTLESKVDERTRELLVAEAEVAQGEKLASVGMLASGIAHELNNPLTGVLTFTSLLRQKLPDGSPDAEDLDLVISETKRCASIIRRLLDFAREKVPVQKFFDLNQLILDTIAFIDRPASLQNVEITTDLDEDLPEIWGDEDLIKQVILNILVNAQQAIEGEGKIAVSTSQRMVHDVNKPAGAPRRCVEIAIRDTGCGIPEANLQRIFDPFFTSKEVGKGTGLGLSVSYGIVKAHGGTIKVESVLGEGSEFRVCLPADPPSTATEQDTSEGAR